ncbi:MAG: hypothetical protein ACRDG7_19120 [Candidatus Limnocylindria bacterium]
MPSLAIPRFLIAGLAAMLLATSAGPVAAHEGALVYNGQWQDQGCADFNPEDLRICYDVSGMVHVTASPSGVLSLTDLTGGHFTVTIEGTVVQDEEFDSNYHLLLVRGDLQQAQLVYRFEGTYDGRACEGRFAWAIADGELRFERFESNCA